MIATVEKTMIPMHRRRVVVAQRLDRRSPETGKAVDRLGEDGATECEPDVHAEHRDDREHARYAGCASG